MELHSGLQPIYVWKINLSGTTLANHSWFWPNSVHMHRSRGDNVHEILDTISPAGVQWGGEGSDESCAAFFCWAYEKLFGNFETYRKRFSKSFCLGVICPQKPHNWRGSNRHLTQTSLQPTVCTAEKCCMLHVVVQGTGSLRGRSLFLYNVCFPRYGASELPILHFCLFSRTKHRKLKYFLVTSLQLRG